MSIISTKTIKYTDFIPANLKFTKLEENDRSNGQSVGYPRYKQNGIDINLEIQLPWVQLFTYGVPPLNQFYKTDGDRSHLKIPLDLNIPEVAEFAEKLKQIDAIMGSSEMMETLLGKKAKKYKYSPLYREIVISEEDSDDENTKKIKSTKPPRPPYFKLKLKLSYPDKKIESNVFETEEIKETGKKNRTKVDTPTLDDFTQYVRYQSLVRPVMKPFKMWAHPLSKKDPEFGISCRLERIEVDKSSIGGSYKSVHDSDRFIDSDDENDKIPTITKTAITKNDDSSDDEKVKPTNNIEVDTDSDDEQIVKKVTQDTKKIEASDSDSDDEPTIKKVTKNTKVIEVSDSDSDNEQNVKKENSDSDDSDDEVVITKPPLKKKATPSKSSKPTSKKA